jgi:protein gp37
MGKQTKIEWCDHTWNPWRGCTKVSAGCANCYAETLSHRNPKVLGEWGPHGTRVLASDAAWREPMKWNAAAKRDGVRRRVFCASLADVFESWDGQMDDHRGRSSWTLEADTTHRTTLDDARRWLFALIQDTPNLDWLLLTKRPENFREMIPFGQGWPWFNVWLGVSVEDQETANRRLPLLMETPAAVRFLSCEPLLGSIDFAKTGVSVHGLDWVIAGGESGPKARPMPLAALHGLANQCTYHAIPFFMKQFGSVLARKWRLRDSKGGDLSEDSSCEWPRDFPRAKVKA